MALQSILPIKNNIAEENLSCISVKQEQINNSEFNVDVKIKTELECEEETITSENPFENVQLQVKQEYVPFQFIEKEEISAHRNENLVITFEREEPEKLITKRNTTQQSPTMYNEKDHLSIKQYADTEMYDIEIKHEHATYDYSNIDDTQSMDSDDANALNNVEACLQDEVNMKSESELYQDQKLNFETVKVKNEMEVTVTETHLISNKLINTTSTITNPQDGLIESRTTKTLVMEILPMLHSGNVALDKMSNPEEILPTTYTKSECTSIDFDDTFQLNSITGNVMSLEQEAYGLLKAKRKIEKLDRPYSCTKCIKAYKTAACLKKHMTVHESIEKRAMGIIKGQKTRLANQKKKLKEEEKKSKPAKKKIKTKKVTPVTVSTSVQSDNVKKEGYECTCGKVFRRRSRMETCLRSHNMYTDSNSYFPCVTCTKQFKNKEDLSLHRKRLHRKRFPCKFCPTDYNTRKELFKHLQIHQKVQITEYKVLSEVVNGKQILKCFMCAKTYSELSDLKSHVMEDHKEPYICPHCNGTFSKIIDFGNHTKTCHPEVEGQSVLDVLEAFSKLVKAWKCEECELQFHEPDKLALHQLEKHSLDPKVESQFQCIDCRRVFISQKGLTSHRRVHHSAENANETENVEKGVLCVECRKICKDMNALTSHMRLHSLDRKYPCKFCDFRFATPEKRKAHAELHTGDMKYVCFICEYQCSSENRLKQHKQSVKHLSMKEFLATGKPLAEAEQSTSKKNEDSLDNEWVVVKDKDKIDDSAEDTSSVVGEGESTCDICGKKFRNESKMLRHQKTHPFIEIPSDDKPTRIFFK